MAVAESFELAGMESDGRHLKYAATDQLLSRRGNLFSRLIWRRVTKYTIGHGYYSQRAIAWLAALWVLSTVLIGLNAGAFTPTDREAAIPASGTSSTAFPPPHETGPGPGASDSEATSAGDSELEVAITTAASQPAPLAYPTFIPPLYAIDIVLSPLGTGQSDAWRVSANMWLTSALTFMLGASRIVRYWDHRRDEQKISRFEATPAETNRRFKPLVSARHRL